MRETRTEGGKVNIYVLGMGRNSHVGIHSRCLFLSHCGGPDQIQPSVAGKINLVQLNQGEDQVKEILVFATTSELFR